jgi:enoyl-CoA hydratase
MKFNTLEYKAEGHVGILTLNRPQAMNALNSELMTELESFLEQVRAEPAIRVLILTGSGPKAFVAGADIKEMDGMNTVSAQVLAERGQALFQKIEELPFATIAAVNGFALGGGLELAMACDFIIASENAKLGLPEVSLGLIPGYGGTQRLARYCGKAIARLMTFSGDLFTAEQCCLWGLVARVTPADQLLPTALKLATQIASRSPKAVSLAKKAILTGYDRSQVDGFKIEAQLFAETFSTQDKVEGVKAFIEKRAPQFTGQ